MAPWLRFLAWRGALLLATLLGVSLLIFVITRVLPGDVATMILGQYATPQDLATLRARLGLDRPAWIQFVAWLWDALRGDLGMSTRFQQPIAFVLQGPVRNSMLLAGAGVLVAVPTGIALGLFCALRRNSAWDHAIATVAVFAAAMPEFVTGGLLVVVFSTWLGWLPPFATIGGPQSVAGGARELVLPVASLSLVILAYILRMMRASAIEVLDSEFVKAAILKGLRRRRVFVHHVLPASLGPTLTVVALSVGWMTGGLVIVESLFGIPGLGRLLVFAIQNRDVPLLQAIALIVAIAYALANLAADLGQRAIDPRTAEP